eukprot:scaffold12304_cov47-Cylindrotheca_fusiformis.AAC.1
MASSSDEDEQMSPVKAAPSPVMKKEQQQNQQSVFESLFRTVVVCINVPPYSMLIWLIIYLLGLVTIPSTTIRTFLVLYFAYGIFDSTPKSPTKPRWVQTLQPYCNKAWFFRWTASYFPCQLHKTCDLPPNKSYIFAYHPHGVIGMGCSTALATDACDFDKVFPGIRRSAATLNVCFWAPFFREWMIANGFCSSNKTTLRSRLNSTEKESVVLVPGGASEALHAHPKQMKLTLLKRKGFIKLAMETKSSIVPVFGFGENDAFDTLYVGCSETKATAILWKIQKGLKQ